MSRVLRCIWNPSTAGYWTLPDGTRYNRQDNLAISGISSDLMHTYHKSVAPYSYLSVIMLLTAMY
eukprot:822144-Amorphochlora_amoeboformis.AAC.1